MNEELTNQKPSLTLGMLLKVGFGRKIVFLVVAIVTSIFLFCSLHFLYSQNNRAYSTSYNYDSRTIQNDKYLDGSAFVLSSIISLDNLNEIKASKNIYQNINTTSIVENNAITLENVTDEKTGVSSIVLSIPTRYFPNQNVAKSFLKDIAKTPITKTIALSKSLTYDNNLSIYKNAASYEKMISSLQAQVSFLDSLYANLIEAYGDLMVTVNGETKQISLFKSDLDGYFEVFSLSALYSQIRENGYVYEFDKHKDELQTQMININAQLATNQTKIDAITQERTTLIDEAAASGLTVQMLDLSSYNSTLNSLYIEKVDLENEKHILEQKITYGPIADTTAFAATLQNYFTKLEEYTTTYKTISTSVIENNLDIYYLKSSGIETSGGLSIIVEIFAAILLGAILGLVVNLIIDRKKLKQNQQVVQKPQQTPKEEQIAASPTQFATINN